MPEARKSPSPTSASMSQAACLTRAGLTESLVPVPACDRAPGSPALVNGGGRSLGSQDGGHRAPRRLTRDDLDDAGFLHVGRQVARPHVLLHDPDIGQLLQPRRTRPSGSADTTACACYVYVWTCVSRDTKARPPPPEPPGPREVTHLSARRHRWGLRPGSESPRIIHSSLGVTRGQLPCVPWGHSRGEATQTAEPSR